MLKHHHNIADRSKIWSNKIGDLWKTTFTRNFSLLRKSGFCDSVLVYFHCTRAATMSGARIAASISNVPWLIRDDPELHSDISWIEMVYREPYMYDVHTWGGGSRGKIVLLGALIVTMDGKGEGVQKFRNVADVIYRSSPICSTESNNICSYVAGPSSF